MGLTDPAGPGRDGGTVEIGGPLPAALIELARSGSAHDKPVAGQGRGAALAGAWLLLTGRLLPGDRLTVGRA